MMKRLFVANTLYQIMTAINLQYTLFKNDSADIFITDCSVGAEQISRNLNQIGLFNHSYYVKTQELIQTKTLIDKGRRFFSYFFANSIMYDGMVPDIDYHYDELLFYNYDSFITYLFKKIEKNNVNAKWSRFEEGYVSYFYGSIESRIVMISEGIKRLLGKRGFMESHCDSYYFYETEFVLFEKKYKIKEIPKINRNDYQLVRIINKTFGINNVVAEYSTKCIFFEESFYINNDGINDEEIIKKVCETVGKDNILVKLHPRNRVNRLSRMGILTNSTIGVPWEVVHLNSSFESKIFIAISCGSVIASKILFGEHVKTYLLYKCTNKRPPLVNDKYEAYLNKMQEKYGEDIIVPNSLEEALMLISEDLKQ